MSPEASMNTIIEIPMSQGLLFIDMMYHELRGILAISCLKVIFFFLLPHCFNCICLAIVL